MDNNNREDISQISSGTSSLTLSSGSNSPTSSAPIALASATTIGRERRGSSASLHNASLLKLLNETKVSALFHQSLFNILFKSPVLVFKSDDTVQHVFEELADKEVLSAPVFDENKKEFVGMVDLRDFVALLLSIHLMGDSSISTAEKLTDFSGNNPFIPVHEDEAIVEVLREFNVRGVHRMPVLDKKDKTKVLCILSQSTIIDWLGKNLDKFGESYSALTLKDLNFGGLDKNNTLSQVIDVLEDDTLLHALSVIEKYNIHGVPVVERESGKLVGNISVRDLKYILEAYIQNLKAPISEFLSKYANKRPPLITCSSSTKFVDVIKLLTDNHVHRAHIVDEENRPVDIITLTNILDIVLALATGARRR